MKISTRLLIPFFMLGIASYLAFYYQSKPKQKYLVCINQLVNHPALDATTKGIIDGLKDFDKTTVIFESAQANPALASQITAKFLSMSADVIVGVATLAAQSVSKAAKEGRTKLIFSSVTDPVGAGLVQSLEKPMNNSSGVSNFVSLQPQLDLIKKIQPDIKKLGFLYNPSEANSITLIKKIEPLAQDQGFELVLQAITKTAEVAQGTASLLSNQVDAIFISNDSTALSALAIIIKTASAKKIPVYVSDTDAVEQGALAAVGPNQYQVGLQTAEMIKQVLQGKDINQLAIEFPKKTELFVNLKAAKDLDLKLDEDLLKSAATIIS